ncbi:MAG: inositol monophosphatase [Alphaproteobacteria bacterium]|nr:inositol monophosphatase [Alphaproteobacteria bacterium]
MRRAAATEVLPRFGNLAPGDVVEKRPGETVTAADTAAEIMLAGLLPAIAPGIVVGEEGIETNPALLDRIKGPDPVWIVDPVDGTTNFSKGISRFAMIVAYARGGETLAGWILDPLNDRAVWAIRGQGAWMAGARIKATPPAPIHSLTGTVGKKFRHTLEARRAKGESSLPKLVSRYGTIGLEYLDIARGELAFMRCVGKLKPWDHAAGVLIHAEAGGYSALGDGEGDYRPGPPRAKDGTLVLAPDKTTWEFLCAAFAAV